MKPGQPSYYTTICRSKPGIVIVKSILALLAVHDSFPKTVQREPGQGDCLVTSRPICSSHPSLVQFFPRSMQRRFFFCAREDVVFPALVRIKETPPTVPHFCLLDRLVLPKLAIFDNCHLNVNFFLNFQSSDGINVCKCKII